MSDTQEFEHSQRPLQPDPETQASQQQPSQQEPPTAPSQEPPTAPSQESPTAPSQEPLTVPSQETSPGWGEPTTAPEQRSSLAGTLVAGIAVGALVGAIVGGGVAALVTANVSPGALPQLPAHSQVTLNNLDTVGEVSGVALAAVASVVTLEVKDGHAAGSGSGVIYREDGYIVTNAHVVGLDGEASANPDIRVWLSDGRIFDGSVVGIDPYADLAVVKIDAEDLQAVALADSSKVNVGDLTVAIGAPLGLASTVTSGVVSALNRGISVGSAIIPDDRLTPQEEFDSDELPWFRFGDPNRERSEQRNAPTFASVTLPVVQTDASINPGNSGGALLNAQAELIGINVAIATNDVDASTAGSVGLGFAIPVNLVKRVAEALIAGERPSHGLLGIGVDDSSHDTDADRNVAGGLIREITPGGPAAAADLRVGDVITAVDGVLVDSGTTVSALIRMYESGTEIVIRYSRNGQAGETTVTLGAL